MKQRTQFKLLTEAILSALQLQHRMAPTLVRLLNANSTNKSQQNGLILYFSR